VRYNQLTQKPVIDPATDEELGAVPEMGPEEAKSAIAAAGKAFASWGKTTARVGILYL
jgi:succinate-semialdehyde dehydrogenase/glutarate-semialdehyde dehydrogenase